MWERNIAEESRDVTINGGYIGFRFSVLKWFAYKARYHGYSERFLWTAEQR